MIPGLTARTPDAQARPAAATRETGFFAGTTILTLDGELPVEFLSPGDRVITRDSGIATLRAVRTRRTVGNAVCIRAGTLGHLRPDQDALLPAGQHVLLRDWRAKALYGTDEALAPAERLVDGEYVTLIEDTALALYELVFDAPHILYADGLEIASTEPVTADA